MPSVPILGWVMPAASRWSRLKATGALIRPSATASLTARARAERSPYPSQQDRAGRPWAGMWRRARSIHRAISGRSGNIVAARSSATARSLSSPERIIHRKGPMPRLNSGRR